MTSVLLPRIATDRHTGTPHVKANGGNSGGEGGSISVQTGQINNLDENVETLIFEARGYNDQQGGDIEINYPNVYFQVNKVISVDAGENATGVGGSITLSEIQVYRWKTGNTGFPEVLWIRNDSPSTTDEDIAAAANTLPSDFLDDLEEGQWNLYAMVSSTDSSLFFHFTVEEGVYGVTRQNIKVSLVLLTDNSYWESTALHECGHALDNIWGYPSQATSWDTALDDEETNFNGQACTTLFAGATSVCTSFPTDTNWDRFRKAVWETYSGATMSAPEKGEIWALMFEYQASRVQANPQYSMTPALEVLLPRCTELNAYMNNLWP